MPDRVGLFDHLMGFLIWIRYWLEALNRDDLKCRASPTGHHVPVARDCKMLCKYCGKLIDRQLPGE
jgi:hypothetical protein